MIVGHANDVVLDAVREAVASGTSFGAPTAVEIEMAEAVVAAVAAQKKFLLRHGFIDRDFDIDDWIARAPLEMARQDG